MTVGQRIKRMREQRGLTQKYVAQEAGINPALLQLYEYGKRNPKDDQLKKIAAAIGVDPVALRPPKIETNTELLYALREIAESFGTVLVQDEGKSVYVKLDGLRLVSNIDPSEPADDVNEAELKDAAECELDKKPEKAAVYTDKELAIRYGRALQEMRLIVKNKTELIANCLRNKDIQMAMANAKVLENTIDVLIKRELETK